MTHNISPLHCARLSFCAAPITQLRRRWRHPLGLAALLVFAWSAPLGAARAVAVIGISGDATVTSEAVSAVSHGVEAELARNRRVLVRPTESVIRALETQGVACVAPRVPAAVAQCGRASGAELVLHGALRYKEGLFLELWLTEVSSQRLLSSVAWTLEDVGDLEELGMDSLERLAREAVRKLFWEGPELFPVRLSEEALSQIGPRARGEVRTQLTLLGLPRGVEIEWVEVRVLRNRSVSSTGVLGLLSGVGWLFLPFWNLEVTLDVQVQLRSFDRNQVTTQTVGGRHSQARPRHAFVESRGVDASKPAESLRIALEQLLGRQNQIKGLDVDRRGFLAGALYGEAR